VNQDSPDTYQLFYATQTDPGRDLTFFRARHAGGEAGFGLAWSRRSPSQGLLDYWPSVFRERRKLEIETRRGERVMAFDDPHGLHIALIETSDKREFTAWNKSPVPKEKQILGLHACVCGRQHRDTASFLTDVLASRKAATMTAGIVTPLPVADQARISTSSNATERRGRWEWAAFTTWRGARRRETKLDCVSAWRSASRPTDVIDRSGSSPSISWNPVVCCSRSRPTARVSPPTKS